MQDLPTTTPTLRDNLLTFLAWFLSGSFITSVVTWLVTRRKTSAETLVLRATETKIEFEAHEVSTRTILEAQARIVELVDINADLHVELTEISRERDNLDFNLRQERHEHEQLKIRSELREHFIQQLEAANKLGVQLRDLPPKPKE